MSPMYRANGHHFVFASSSVNIYRPISLRINISSAPNGDRCMREARKMRRAARAVRRAFTWRRIKGITGASPSLTVLPMPWNCV